MGKDDNLIIPERSIEEKGLEVEWSTRFTNNSNLNFSVRRAEFTLLDDFDPTRVQEDDIFITAGSEIKNTRRVDFRHEEKYEREILLDYFVSNGLIDINDYRSITTLIDAWQFEDFITRQHGKTIEYGFEFEYDILDVTAFSIGQRFNSEAITIVFNSKKAKSLKKQIDHTLGVKGGFWNLSPLNDNDINKRNFYQIDYNFNYGYFLSARTNFNLRLNASALGFLKSSETQNSLSVNLRYNYYISPNYRFSIIGQVNTFKQDIRNYNFVNNERTHFAVRLDYFVY